MTTSGFKKYYILVTQKSSGTGTTDATWCVERKGPKNVDEVLSTSFFSHLRDIVESKADVSVKANIQIQINTILSASSTNTARANACSTLEGMLSVDDAMMSWVDTAWKNVNMEIAGDLRKPEADRKFRISEDSYTAYYTREDGTALKKPENSYVTYYRSKLMANGGVMGEAEPVRVSVRPAPAPVAPVETPVDPVIPVTPVTPVEPAAPVAPVAPATPVAPVAPADPAPVEKRLAAAEKKSAKYSRFWNYTGRNGHWLGGLGLLAFAVGVAVATTGASLLGIVLYSTIAVVSATIVVCATPLRHARIRSKIREKIYKVTNKSYTNLKEFHKNMRIVNQQASSKHPTQATESLRKAKMYLQTAVNELNRALLHQESLYDTIKARSKKVSTSKAIKLQSMPVALRHFLRAFIETEQAMHRYNDDVATINARDGYTLDAERISAWNDLKEKVLRYYPGELNREYKELGITRKSGVPTRVDASGKKLDPSDFDAEAPVVTPVAPVVTPVAPVVTPVTPVAPVVTPVTPVAPVVTPVAGGDDPFSDLV